MAFPIISNCTITGNTASNNGGAIYNEQSSYSINNSIIYANTATLGKQIYNYSGTIEINNSCISNGENDMLVAEGIIDALNNNNITSNPKFINTSIGDYRLCGTSPCVNAGSNEYIVAPYLILTTDIRGNDFGRSLNKNNGELDTVDIGAYEYKFGTDPASMTIHVNDKADGLNNGSNWTDGLTSLQSALDIASNRDQIWVAKGIYKPSYDYELEIGERGKHFRMKKGVEMYGGFAGTETDESQRTAYGIGGANETILSGDLNNDDIISGSGATLSITNNLDNCYHVFYHPQGLGLASTEVLNGFTISGGNADGTSPHNAGAAVFNSYNSPAIINCQIMNNGANTGAGLYNSSSSPIINNCIFYNNKATSYAGAIYNLNSTNTVNNCTIYGNAGNQGGAFYNTSSISTINNSIIWANSSTTGKQIYNYSGTTTLNYSCYSNVGSDITINSGTLTATNNNITTNPRFVDPTAGDFRIDGSSNCVDAGNDSYCTELTDIRGNSISRKLNKMNGELGRIDIGAYEYKLGTDPLAQPTIIYVNDDASGGNNGSSWENSFNSFQSALDYAVSGDKIWVAGGTYKPNSAYDLTNTSRYYHFRMKHGVEIYGGFAGTETDTSQRTNYKSGGVNETILSGDVDNNNALDDGNCYHVFYHPYGLGITNSDIIDGITIKGGYAQHYINLFSSGGGMYNSYNSPTISNCVISTNNGGGGAIYNEGCQTIIRNSDFCNNIAYPISNSSCSPTIDNCKFYNNPSGAIYNEGASPTITDCDIYNNGNNYSNGSISNLFSSPLILNCRFYGNTSMQGGAVHNRTSSNPIIRNCLIYNNYGIRGGAIYNMTSSPQVINSVFYGNSSNYGGFMSNELGSSPQVTNCTIYGNSASQGGAVYNYDNSNSTLSINNSIIWGNTATTGKQFYDYGTCTTTLNHSCYSNSTGDLSVSLGFNASNDCNSDNPRFVDADNHDFSLKGFSSCVNTGDNAYNTETYDIRGQARIQNTTIDLGAFEWTSSIDPTAYASVQASNILFSKVSRNGMTIRWTRGNGEGSILLAKQQYRIATSPLTNGTPLTGNNNYTLAPTVGGAKVLYFGTDENPSVSISGLTRYQLVYFKVCEYNNASSPYYLQTENSTNPRSRWTLRRDGLAEEDLSIDSEYPYPNPVSNSINTKLDVFDAGNITAYLFDNSGRQIAELYNQYHDFGTYQLNFDLSQIAQGTYQLVINKGSEAVVYPISIVR